jgi:hypothetical protein
MARFQRAIFDAVRVIVFLVLCCVTNSNYIYAFFSGGVFVIEVGSLWT